MGKLKELKNINIYEEAKCIRKNKANYHGNQSHIPLVLNIGSTNILFEIDQYLIWLSDAIFSGHQMLVIFREDFLIVDIDNDI